MTARFDPTDEERMDVLMKCAVGIPQEGIALLMRDGIDVKTLRKSFKRELEIGKLQANAMVGETLWKKAVSGDTSSMIFWAKTQMGWKETNVVENETTITVVRRVIVDPDETKMIDITPEIDVDA